MQQCDSVCFSFIPTLPQTKIPTAPQETSSTSKDESIASKAQKARRQIQIDSLQRALAADHLVQSGQEQEYVIFAGPNYSSEHCGLAVAAQLAQFDRGSISHQWPGGFQVNHQRGSGPRPNLCEDFAACWLFFLLPRRQDQGLRSATGVCSMRLCRPCLFRISTILRYNIIWGIIISFLVLDYSIFM